MLHPDALNMIFPRSSIYARSSAWSALAHPLGNQRIEVFHRSRATRAIQRSLGKRETATTEALISTDGNTFLAQAPNTSPALR